MNKNKEELLNKLKQLEEDFNTQVADIKKQIEKCDNKFYKPTKFGEKYYAILTNGEINTYNFFNYFSFLAHLSTYYTLTSF